MKKIKTGDPFRPHPCRRVCFQRQDQQSDESLCAGLCRRSGEHQGNVNVEDYYERDARFAIGAGEDGYAVFKDPGEAFAALREHYPEGISLIRKEFHLLWLSKLNYPSYQTYGWQATTGSEEARQQAQFVSRFFDIYENSFK